MTTHVSTTCLFTPLPSRQPVVLLTPSALRDSRRKRQGNGDAALPESLVFAPTLFHHFITNDHGPFDPRLAEWSPMPSFSPRGVPTKRSIVAICALLLVAIGCGDAGSSSQEGASGAPDGLPTIETSQMSLVADAPSGQTSTRILMVGGAARSYVLHLPPPSFHGPFALMLNFHGLGNSAPQQEAWSEMDAVADREGFIVAYPSGAGSPASWNAGSCCDFDQPSRDDVAFTSAVIDDIEAGRAVDASRVYAVGMSNGAFMAYTLACDLSSRIAGIASVGGVLDVTHQNCHPQHPVPIIDFHGTADPVLPYNGGISLFLALTFPAQQLPPFLSVPATRRAWSTIDGCSDAEVTSYSRGDATCVTQPRCAGGTMITFCSIQGGGHTWPGGDIGAVPFGTLVFGKTSTSIDASAMIWSFLKGFRLPSRG